MKEIVLVLSKADKAHLARVRCEPNLLVAEAEGDIWLRGVSSSDYVLSATRYLPSTHTYLLDNDGNLFPVGGLTPVQKMRELSWLKVAEYCSVEFPTAALPAIVENRYELKLVQSDRIRAAAAITTSLQLFRTYAESAPEVRLSTIRFAVSENEKVIVLGDLLPPIPGEEYWLNNNILLPAGFDFEIPLLSKLISRKIKDDNAIIIFYTTAAYELINMENFMKGSRRAIRLTKKTKDE